MTHYAPIRARAKARAADVLPSGSGCHILGQPSQLGDWCHGELVRGDTVGRLVSVNVGMPKNVQWRDKTVYTGIWKTPVDGPVMVRRLNVDGDGQGDLAGHGGEQRAVMVYQSESYDFWKTYLGRDDLRAGNFGENFTVTGLADDDVCIGDRYRIGDAEFEVTQPRVTCFRVGMRLDEPDMPNLLVSQHRPGFYFRVITEGRVRAGRRHRADPSRPSRTQRRRRRCAAVPAEPQRQTTPQGYRRSGAQSRLAAVVSRHAGDAPRRSGNRRSECSPDGRDFAAYGSPTHVGRVRK